MSTNETLLPFTKTFIWRFLDKGDVSKFDHFRDLSIVRGEEFEQTLLKMVQAYIEQHDVPFTLVNEQQLMTKLANEGLLVSRMTLRSYRERGLFQDEHGNSISWTMGQQVRYNLEECIKFFQRKRLRDQAA